MTPAVTVAVCSHNGDATLRAALDSIWAQRLESRRYEVLLVDDGSIDATESLVAPYRSRPNFRYLKNEMNRGLAFSANRALEEAAAPFFIRLDADDAFEPAILAELLAPMEAGVADIATCDRYELDLRTGDKRLVKLGSFNVFGLIACGVMMRRDMLREIGGYGNLFWEEYDLYIRYLTKSGRIPRHIPKPLLTYTLHPGSMTADHERVRAGWEEFLRKWPVEEASKFGKLPEAALQAARGGPL